MQKENDIFESSHASDVLSRFNEFRKNGQYCDFTIKCGAEIIPVHKCLIAASSEYFNAMFSHDTKENQEGEVEIKDVNPGSLVECLDFMYTGITGCSNENLTDLIHVARLLGLEKLCNHIVAFLIKNMDSDSFYSLRAIANAYGFQKLLDSCNEFAEDNFHIIMKMEEFKDLEPEYLGSLLSSKELNLLDNVKCKAIMVWAGNDCSRAAPMYSLLKRLDMSKVLLSYRKFLLDTPIVFKSPMCLRYIMDTMPEAVGVKAADYEGECNPCLIIANRNSGYLERFDLEKETWTVMHALRDYNARDPPSMICVNQYLYMFRWDRCFLCLRFTDPGSEWKVLNTVPALDRRTCNGPIVAINGILYLSNFLVATHQIWQYDISRDHWSKLPPKKHKISGSSLAVANGKLFVIGGTELIGGVTWYHDRSDVECYDPSSSTWSSDVCSLNESRSLASACAHKNVVYVFGGWKKDDYLRLESVEILRSESSPWEILQLDILPYQISLSHNVNGKILLVGDLLADPDGPDLVSVFDPKSNDIVSRFPITTTDNDFRISYLSAVVYM